ncbi:alpha/beta hydrolase [Parahaliea aestuarii]|uniref:Alpha/beta hydrolase n=1 Tax=Parahaliea aestuarii TaxID=1852021 RepID=A0A5C9A0M2_9GAMM|nr:alpha/beta hydrolase [Parahaliea aestuarii]TXS94415.1 alpha/beta hydrolase [Parahaliea aestuarii]
MSYNFDPEIAALLEFMPPVDVADPAAARAAFAGATAALIADLDTSGVDISDRAAPGLNGAPEVAVRVYRPAAADGPVPGLVYIHGGGFVLGNLDSEHGICVNLCRALGIVVVSVDYRLSPETAYPGPQDDCYAALQWTAANAAGLGIDPQRLGIGGQSAGGCLAAACALRARDEKGPALCFQFLGIPVLDDRLDTPSMVQFSDTPCWDSGKAALSWKFYLGDSLNAGADNVPAYAAPARASDLAGLPPAYITTMEFDPLRDEGLQYGMRLLAAGVPCELHNYPGTFHGSSVFAHTAIHQRELADTLAVLRRGLGVDQSG